MKYTQIMQGTFINRPNRFIANVEINGETETVHVKNTGRCREILLPGTGVILERGKNPERKTKYDLIAAYKGDMLINIDSQVPNLVAYEGILEGKIHEVGSPAFLKREVTYGNSRFDLYFEDGDRKGFIEVKGVTLEADGVVRFPDAPTLRGTKHVLELIDAGSNGYEAYILFVIQLKGAKVFKPNFITDRAFGEALYKASQNGVKILVYECNVEEDSIKIAGKVAYDIDPVPLTP